MNRTLIQPLFSAVLKLLKLPLQWLWRFFTNTATSWDQLLTRYWWVVAGFLCLLGLLADSLLRSHRRESLLHHRAREQVKKVAPEPVQPEPPVQEPVPDWRDAYRPPASALHYEPVRREMERPVFDEEPPIPRRRRDMMNGYAPPVPPAEYYAGGDNPGLHTEYLRSNLNLPPEGVPRVESQPISFDQPQPEPATGLNRLAQKAKSFLFEEDNPASGYGSLTAGKDPGQYFPVRQEEEQ